MSATVLVIEDEETARHNYCAYLSKKGYETVEAGTLAEAREHISAGKADIILLDVRLPDGYGPDLLVETSSLPIRPPVIIITAYGDIEMAVEAMKNGAHDFLQKPIDLKQLLTSIERAKDIVLMRRELTHYRMEQRNQIKFVIGQTARMQEIIEQAQRAAAASASVLITGETGSGKEVLARAIRDMGPRKDKPFIGINCAAIQPTVLESELFGHEAGAFTSAEKRKIGLMETADEGILFLDEISGMSLEMQTKLLRALEEREIRRVGGTKPIKVDIQVIAASNRDMQKLIDENKFRSDLYYRLNVVHLDIPPLRERKVDIPEFVALFINTNNLKMGMNIEGLTDRALNALKRYNWPGNVRELRNIIERAMLFCDDALIDINVLPPEIANLAK